MDERDVEKVASTTRWISRWVGMPLIVAVGLIHMVMLHHHFGAAAYLGGLFLANVIGSLVAAVGLYKGARWGWFLGLPIAAASFVLFLVSRTLGLPATGEELVGHWNTLGIISLIVEGLFVGLYLSVATLRGR